MSLWVPPTVARDLRDETLAHDMMVAEVSHRTGICREFTRELRLIDPHLELIYWPPNASAPGFVPGCYHIIRQNPGAPTGVVEPLTDELGNYREPDSSIFDVVRRADLWNDEVVRDRKRMMQAALDAKASMEQAEREERQEEILERWKAATQTRVSMNRDTPWSQNMAGRRGATVKESGRPD